MVTGNLLTITRLLPAPSRVPRSFPLPSFFPPFRESSRERPLLPALSLLEPELPESLPRLLLSLLELLLELLLLELLLELESDRGDSAGALGVSLFGLSLGGVRPSCAFEAVAAKPPMKSTSAVLIAPFLILSRLNFIVVSLCGGWTAGRVFDRPRLYSQIRIVK